MSMATTFTVSAQNVTFYSSEFAEGVKTHLGLDDNSVVTQQQTDTITAINLSGYGIKDIRDVVYLPNVHTLDLSYNEIREVDPLLPLDSLHYVDLRGNLLEDINVLSFSCSDSLVLSVAYNYIKDFSRLLLPSSCHISISGMSAQKDKNASYMKVYQFYADIQEGQPVINYRGYSNMGNDIILECGSTHMAAEMTGNFNTMRITDNLSSTTKATLSNGETGDTTWVVPPVDYETAPEQTVTVETGLPENYTIGSANALYGTVVINGTDLVYTAPDVAVSDTLSFSYYKRGVLKGFSRYFLGKPRWRLGDVNKDLFVDVSDVMLVVNHILGNTLSFFYGEYADMNSDGIVDVTDIMLIVNVILNPDKMHAPTAPRRDGLWLKTEGDQTLVNVPFASNYTACQMTVHLSDGMELTGTQLCGDDSREMRTNMLPDGSWRLVVYSPDGAPLCATDEGLLRINTSGKGQVALSDVVFSTMQCESIAFSDMTATTGIDDDGMDASPAGDLYDLGGRRHHTTPHHSGIYIQNRKAHTVKEK